MKGKSVVTAHQTYHFVVLGPDDEVIDALLEYAGQNDIKGGRVTALGAFSSAVLGFFDYSVGDYREIRVDEQVEVACFLGHYAVRDGTPRIHAHCVLSRKDGSTVGGHLFRAQVHPTLELIVTELPDTFFHHAHPEQGLASLYP